MAEIVIKGIHKIRRKLAGGKVRYHYYTDRHGGPRFFTSDDKPANMDSKAFQSAYLKAVDRERGGPPGTLGRVITEYLGTISGKAKATQKTYRLHCDLVRREFGKTPLRLFDDPRIRRKIIEWRDSMAGTPNKADKCVGQLALILQHAVNNGDLSYNRAQKIPNIYKQDLDAPIWTQAEISAYLSDCSEHLSWHLRLKLYTGLRRTDITALPLSADKGTHIDWRTSKTGKHIVVPITRECRAVLDEIKAYRAEHEITAFTILFNSRGKPWTKGGINASSRKQRVKHGITVREHRLRGNFVTHLILAGFKDEDIAYIVGWSVDKVKDMRRIYVDQNEILIAQIRRLNA